MFSIKNNVYISNRVDNEAESPVDLEPKDDNVTNYHEKIASIVKDLEGIAAMKDAIKNLKCNSTAACYCDYNSRCCFKVSFAIDAYQMQITKLQALNKKYVKTLEEKRTELRGVNELILQLEELKTKYT